MQAKFWHERWESGQLGSHQAEWNPLLLRHWHRLGREGSACVFVPLCGKTRDMTWLRDQGHGILEYDASKMKGPPHSVPKAEVEGLFGAGFEIDWVESTKPVPPTPRFQERGLDLWHEHVAVLTRNECSPRARPESRTESGNA